MQPPHPIIVRVMDQPVRPTSVGDVIVGAVGLTGALILVALLLGATLGAILIGIKKLRARGRDTDPDTDPIHISPYA